MGAFRAGRGLLATRASTATRATLLNAADGPVLAALGRVPLAGAVFRGGAGVVRTLAPVAAKFTYLRVRFTPLATPGRLQVLAYNGRKWAAVRNEAVEWTTRGDDVAAFGEKILRSGLISGMRYVPRITVVGSIATYTAAGRDIEQTISGLLDR